MSGEWGEAAVRTVGLMAAAVAIALPLGAVWGVAIVRSGRRAATASLVAAAIAAALPLYVQAAAWEATWGKFGWLPLSQVAGRSWAVGGFFATAWIHGAAGAGWVALASVWAWRRVPAELLDAAELDVGRAWGLVRVGLPAVAPALLAASAWVAVMAASEFTVANLYGVRTLADDLYMAQSAGVEGGGTIAACLVPWGAVVIVASVVWRRVPRGGWIGPAARPAAADPWARVVAVLGPAVVLGVPIASLVLKAGWISRWDGTTARPGFSVWAACETMAVSWSEFADELRGSAMLAVVTAAAAVALAWGIWSLVAGHRARRGVVALLLAGALLPAPVVALAMVGLFDRAWPPGLAALYDRSLVPAVLAILPRAVPAALLVIAAGGVGIRSSVHEAARIDGGPALARWWAIERVLMAPAVGVAMGVAMLVALGDLASSLLVLPPGVATVSVRMFGLLHSGVRRQEAGLGLVTAIGVAIVVTAIVLGGRWRGGRRTPGG